MRSASCTTTLRREPTGPRAQNRAKTAFLEKERAAVGEVISYRVLLIMAALYRIWATIRLGMLQPWVQQWAMPEMFAGTGGQGAEDAWNQLSMCAVYNQILRVIF